MNSTTTLTDTLGANPATQSDGQSQPQGCCGMDMPGPTKEHEWLQQLVGTWDSEIEIAMEPGQPPMKSNGEEVVRMLGDFWLISEGRNLSMPYECRLTLGYDPLKQKYVGTWNDTMMSHLWIYEGSVDATGRILTLNTEGPAPTEPGVTWRFKEVTEIKDKDHRVFNSYRQLANGEWTSCLKIEFRRRA